MVQLVQLFCTLLFIAAGGFANAQAADGDSVLNAQGSNAKYEFGIDIADLLPDQIGGVSEIMGLGGARVGFRLAPLNYAEFNLFSGNGDGQQWRDFSADIRTDLPIENLLGLAFVGLDAYDFKGRGQGKRLIFGGHVGGGLQAHVGGPIWVRADMKFGFSPGTSLVISLGLTWRFGDSTSN